MEPAPLSTPGLFLYDQEALHRFRRALRRADQQALDDLLRATQKLLADIPGAGESLVGRLPFEVFLVLLFLEQYKEIQRLRQALALISAALRDD